MDNILIRVLFSCRQTVELHVNGTMEEPIVFQGDRLEEEYENDQGQWAGIRLLQESKGNKFEYTTIKKFYCRIEIG